MKSAPFSKILAPVDLSPCSTAALELACKLAQPFGARVEVLFVCASKASESGASSEPPSASELSAARAKLHRFVQSVPGARGESITERVAVGFAYEEILRSAAEGAFDAIVLGTHGRTGRARTLAGSVAESTVRLATCPVITVRQAR